MRTTAGAGACPGSSMIYTVPSRRTVRLCAASSAFSVVDSDRFSSRPVTFASGLTPLPSTTCTPYCCANWSTTRASVSFWKLTLTSGSAGGTSRTISPPSAFSSFGVWVRFARAAQRLTCCWTYAASPLSVTRPSLAAWPASPLARYSVNTPCPASGSSQARSPASQASSVATTRGRGTVATALNIGCRPRARPSDSLASASPRPFCGSLRQASRMNSTSLAWSPSSALLTSRIGRLMSCTRSTCASTVSR